MIGGLLERIRTAEGRALEIVSDARSQAAQIENEARLEIEKINHATEDAVAKKMHIAEKSPPHDVAPCPAVKVVCSDAQFAAAKQFITDEFYKRYTQ